MWRLFTMPIYPVCDETMIDPLLEERMQLAQETCFFGIVIA
jgi:hypothetical protein